MVAPRWQVWAGATIASLLLPLLGSAAILKGPWVLLESDTSLSIRLELDQPEGRIVLHADDGRRVAVTPDFTRSRRDTFLATVTVDLTGLPGFTGYEVGHAGAGTFFEWRSRLNGRPMPPPRLLVFGDPQGGAVLRQFGKRWAAEDFDVLVSVGDLVDAGTRYESWQEEFFGPLQALLPGRPLLAVPGNHESYRGQSLYWHDWHLGRSDGSRHFRIDLAGTRLIGLDNADAHTKYGFGPFEPLTPQYDFLVEALFGTAPAPPRVLLFGHVPAYSGSTVVNREFGSEIQRRYLEPLVARSTSAAFITGHHHKYERLLRPGLRRPTHYVVTGGAGGGLFGPDLPRGPQPMDREVFEVFHDLLIDLAGLGEASVRSLDGRELERFGLAALNPPGDFALPAIQLAEIRPDFGAADADGAPLRRVRLPPAPAAGMVTPAPFSASLLRRGGNLALLVRGAGPLANDGGLLSLQGYQWERKSWGYLQGAALTFPFNGLYGRVAVITLNGTDLHPLDRAFPVLHWPVAERRAGVSADRGAILLLRDRANFDLVPDPARIQASWTWGARAELDLASEQWSRQWSFLRAARQPVDLADDPAASLFEELGGPAAISAYRVIAENRRTLATLLHWREQDFLALVFGESIPRAEGVIFLSGTAAAVLTVERRDGWAGLHVDRPGRPDLFIPVEPVARPGAAGSG